MVSTPPPLRWDDLAPYITEPPALDPWESEPPTIGEVFQVEVDGVVWVTDQYLVARRDLFDGDPPEWVQVREHPKLHEYMREVLDMDEGGGEKFIHPLVLDVADRLGVTPVRQGPNWFLRDSEGVLLVISAGIVPHNLRKRFYKPFLPGLELGRARLIVEELPLSLPKSRRWEVAFNILQTLDVDWITGSKKGGCAK